MVSSGNDAGRQNRSQNLAGINLLKLLIVTLCSGDAPTPGIFLATIDPEVGLASNNLGVNVKIVTSPIPGEKGTWQRAPTGAFGAIGKKRGRGMPCPYQDGDLPAAPAIECARQIASFWFFNPQSAIRNRPL